MYLSGYHLVTDIRSFRAGSKLRGLNYRTRLFSIAGFCDKGAAKIGTCNDAGVGGHVSIENL